MMEDVYVSLHGQCSGCYSKIQSAKKFDGLAVGVSKQQSEVLVLKAFPDICSTIVFINSNRWQMIIIKFIKTHLKL